MGHPQNLLSDETITNLKKLLRQYPEGIDVAKCLELYEQRFAGPLRVQGLANATLAEVFSTLKFAVVETRPHPINPINNIQFIKGTPEFLSKHKREKKAPAQKKPLINTRIMYRIVVENLAISVTEEDLMTLFSHFGPVKQVKLDSSDHTGRVDMDDNSSARQAVQACHQQLLDGQLITCQLFEEEVVEEASPIEQPKKTLGKIYQLELPESIKQGQFLDVCMGEVFTPHKFYLQLKSNYKMLNDLMDELDDFYTSGPGISKKYLLSDDHCTQVGRTCAVLYLGNMWHRGIITDFNQESQMLSVYYNDYGSIAVVPRHHARILHPEFAELEGQAIICKLSGIIPNSTNGQWSTEAGNMVLKMAQDCDGFLVAEIVNVLVHNEERTRYELEVVLYDTVTNDDPQGLIFSENLIDAGLAIRQYNYGDLEEEGFAKEEENGELEVTNYQKFDISSHVARTKRMPVNWKKVERVLNHHGYKNVSSNGIDDSDDESFHSSLKT